MAATDLPEEQLEDEVVKFVTEALSNALRHSGGDEVAVVVDTDTDWCRISVSDNGIGFDPTQSSTGMGLANMTTRAASLGGNADVGSNMGRGPTVEVRLPIR